MRIDIHDFFEGYEDNSLLALSSESVNSQRIKELTMKKTNIKKKHISPKLIVAAACAAILTITAIAAVTSGIRSRDVNQTDYNSVTYNWGTQSITYPDLGKIINLDIDESKTYYHVYFKASYLPAQSDTDSKGYLYGYLDQYGVYDMESIIESSGLSEQQLKEECMNHTAYSDNNGHFYMIDIVNGKRAQRTDFLFNGKADLVKQSEINGLEASYFTVDYTETGISGFGVRQHLLLFSREDGYFINIASQGYDFDELTKIAENLEVYVTNIEATRLGASEAYLLDGAMG